MNKGVRYWFALACGLVSAQGALADCKTPTTLDAPPLVRQLDGSLTPGTKQAWCTWRTFSFSPTTGCGISYLRVEGMGGRPVHVSLFREADNVNEQNMDTLPPNSLYPGVEWHAQVNFNANNALACEPGTCPTSRYRIQTDETMLVNACLQDVRLVIAPRR